MLGELEFDSSQWGAGVGQWDEGKHSPDGTEQSTVTLLLQRVNGLVGQGGTSALEGIVTGFEVDEAELEVQGRREGLQDTAASLDCIGQFIRSSNWWFGLLVRELPTGMTSRPMPSPGMRPIRLRLDSIHSSSHQPCRGSYQCEESEQQQPL